jgi:hypothetical protein
MSDPSTVVHAQVLLLKHNSSGNETLTWTPGQYSVNLTIDALAMQVVDPDTLTASDGRVGYTFGLEMLQTTLDVMYSRLSVGGVTPILTNVPSGASCIPYANSVNSGRILLMATGTEGGGAPKVVRRSTKAADRMVDCTICEPSVAWLLSKMMLHTGHHILNGGVSLDSPCGVCGQHSLSQYTADPSAVDGCAAWLSAKHGTELGGKGKQDPTIHCKLAGQFTFSLKVASHFTKDDPCTNTLFLCPECPKKPTPFFFWKYAGCDM